MTHEIGWSSHSLGRGVFGFILCVGRCDELVKLKHLDQSLIAQHVNKKGNFDILSFWDAMAESFPVLTTMAEQVMG